MTQSSLLGSSKIYVDNNIQQLKYMMILRLWDGVYKATAEAKCKNFPRLTQE